MNGLESLIHVGRSLQPLPSSQRSNDIELLRPLIRCQNHIKLLCAKPCPKDRNLNCKLTTIQGDAIGLVAGLCAGGLSLAERLSAPTIRMPFSGQNDWNL